MELQLQPYPLFAAFFVGKDVKTGRVIGWAPKPGDGTLRPLVALPGSAPDYVTTQYWLADKLEHAELQAKTSQRP
jgi:hypothetical protein